MKQWPHVGFIALAVVITVLGIMSGCSKDQESASGAAANQLAPPSVTPRSHALIEEPAAHPTPTAAAERAGAAEANTAAEVSVSVDGEPTSGGAPLTVSFSAEVSGGSTDLHYRWDFGDHSPPTGRLDVQHTYVAPGDYTATFTATGPGVNESEEVAIEVTEEGFDLDVDADPDIGIAPLAVQFSAVLDEDDVALPLSFQWDFGDGSRDVSNPTRHTYRLPGQYTVTLLVTNGIGQIARRDIEIQVDPREEQ